MQSQLRHQLFHLGTSFKGILFPEVCIIKDSELAAKELLSFAVHLIPMQVSHASDQLLIPFKL